MFKLLLVSLIDHLKIPSHWVITEIKIDSHLVFKIGPCCSIYEPARGLHLLPWPRTILTCVRATFCPSIHQDELSDCFHFRVLRNTAAHLWTFICKFLCGHVLSFLLSVCLGLRFLGHMVTLCFTFWGATKGFLQLEVPFYIPISRAWGFWLLHILTSTCHYLSFWF